MNRDFFIRDLTPARARKISSVMKAASVYIDPRILDLASEDRIADELAPEVLPIAQFILDHDRRCVVPYEGKAEVVRDAIAYCLPRDRRVIFVDDAIHWNRRIKTRLSSYRSESDEQYQFASSTLNPRHLIKDRDAIVVANTDTNSLYHYPWLGKVFRETILYCEYEHQYGLFGSRSVTNSAVIAATILNPALGQMEANHILSRGVERSLPLCAAYNGLVKEKQQEKVSK